MCVLVRLSTLFVLMLSMEILLLNWFGGRVPMISLTSTSCNDAFISSLFPRWRQSGNCVNCVVLNWPSVVSVVQRHLLMWNEHFEMEAEEISDKNHHVPCASTQALQCLAFHVGAACAHLTLMTWSCCIWEAWVLVIEASCVLLLSSELSSTHSLSRPSSMTVGDCRWPLNCLSSPLFPVLWHLLQLNVATTTPFFYVVHPLSFGSSLVT